MNDSVNTKDFIYFNSRGSIETEILCRYSGTEKNVVIPDNVKMIEFDCFENNKTIESVEIPESVELIKSSAFAGCTNLKSVKIPDALYGIAPDCFGDAETTAKFLLANPNYEEQGGLIINKITKTVLFALDDSKDGYEIPEGTKNIGAYAFCGCNELKEIKIPEGVEAICIMAFFMCEKLTKIQFPESLKVIAKAAFVHCSSLKDFTLPENAEIAETGNWILFEKNNE